MKINGGVKVPGLDGQLNKSSRKKDAPSIDGKGSSVQSGGRAGGLKGDNVNISVKARDVQAARDLLNAVPEIREDRVEEIKGRIQSGNYDVKGEAIASGIVKASLLDKMM